VAKVVKYIKDEQLDSFPGGLPTTKIETGSPIDFLKS
jgi:hypothetical protein